MHPLDPGAADRCPRCGSQVRGGAADRLRAIVGRLAQLGAEQRAIGAEVAALTAEQAALRTVLAPPAAPLIPPTAWAPPAPAPRPAAGEWRPSAVRGLLLWLGAGLIAVAAIIFAAVSWARLSSAGRLGLLAAVTVAAAGITMLTRRRLPATAEAMAALTIALVLVDWGVADLAGLDGGWSGAGWWALGCWLTGALAIAAGRVLRAPRWIGAGLVQLALLLAVFALDLPALASGLLLAAAAAAGTAAGIRLRGVPGWRPAAVVTLVGAALLELIAIGPALAELFENRTGRAAAILAAMALAPAVARLLRRPEGWAGHLLVATAAGLLLAAGSSALAVWTSGWALAAAVTILAAAATGAIRLLPRPIAPGAALAGVTALAAGAALPLAAALAAIVGPLTSADAPWTGTPGAPEGIWPGPGAALPVMLALAAVAAAARLAASTGGKPEEAGAAAEGRVPNRPAEQGPAGAALAAGAGAPGRMPAPAAAPWAPGTPAAGSTPAGWMTEGAVLPGRAGGPRPAWPVTAGAPVRRPVPFTWDGRWPAPLAGAAGVTALAGLAAIAPVAGRSGSAAALIVTSLCSLVAAGLAALADRGGRGLAAVLAAGFAAVTGVAALGWALTSEAGTLVHVALVAAVTGAGAWTARSAWLRGTLAAVAATAVLGEAAAVTVSRGGGVAEAGIALAVTGGLLLAAGTRLPLRTPIAPVAECAGLGGLAAGLALTADRTGAGWAGHGAPLAVALTVAVPMLLLAGGGRRAYRWAALAASVAATWAWLAVAEVGTPEAYTLPAAAAALVPGLTLLRGRGSWLAYGPGLGIGLLPSLALTLGTEGVVRPVLLATAAFGIVLAGAWSRLQAPLVLGASTLVVLGIDALGPVAVALPRWLTIGTAGLLLLWVGATWERRRDQLRELRERYDGLEPRP
jgi:hypothetical protein